MKTPTDYLIELNDFLKDKEKEDFYEIENYKKAAILFQKLVDADIKRIWEKHKDTLYMYINNVAICSKWSVVNSSTAFWFIVEEFLSKEMLDCFIWPTNSTANSSYDLIFKNYQEKIILSINLKVEKKWSTNNAITWWKSLQGFYLKDKDIPKLYLISKSKYFIDENKSELKIEWYNSYFLESFLIWYVLKADHRNWSKDYNPLSWRIQSPVKKELQKFWIDKIPEYNKIYNFIKNLEKNYEKK